MAKSNSAQAPERPPQPRSGYERLEVFVGEWETEGRQYDGPFGPDTQFIAMESYRWLTGGFFLIHRLEGRFGENEAACVEIISHDALSQSYPSQAFYNDGATNEWQTRERDGIWALTGDSQVADGLLKVRCTTEFSDAGNTRDGRWEFSSDGSNWQLFLESRATRV